MKFAISAALLSLVGLVASASVARQSCAEAARFGALTISPTTFNLGDDINIKVDFTCGINWFGIVPKFLDYTIQVFAASNNGHEPPIVLARRTLQPGALSDTFTTQIPYVFFFVGAPYQVVLTNTYPINGTDGSEVLIQGSVEQGITINA